MSLLGREYLSVPIREDPPGPDDAPLPRRASPRRRIRAAAGRRGARRDGPTRRAAPRHAPGRYDLVADAR